LSCRNISLSYAWVFWGVRAGRAGRGEARPGGAKNSSRLNGRDHVINSMMMMILALDVASYAIILDLEAILEFDDILI
jgi:hypothetical protein